MSTTTSRRVTNAPTQPAQRLTLANAIAGSKKLPTRLVVQGQGGIGKTSFAAQAPSPFFLLSPGETGLHTLMDSGLLPDTPNLEVHTFEDALAILDELAVSEGDRKTLVVDAADGIEKVANDFVCRTEFGGDWGEKGFQGFQRGYKVTAAGPWRQFLGALDRIREQRRMGIILLCHTGIGNFMNPEGPDFNRWTADMHKDCWQLTMAWADIVLYAGREVAVVKEKGERKAKGSGLDDRVLRTSWTATADAKNRHNLPDEISMGESAAEAWHNFTSALQAAKQNGATSNG